MKTNKLKYECLKPMETVDAVYVKWVSILFIVSTSGCLMPLGIRIAENLARVKFRIEKLDVRIENWWGKPQPYTGKLKNKK
jgi:hypothetical protein